MRRANVIACAVLCAWSMLHGGARAQQALEPGAAETAVARRAARGTHFILAAEGGVTPGETVCCAGSLLLGAGGRPRGTPLRVYGLAELSLLDRSPAIAVRAPSVHVDERTYLGLALGVRLYLPIGWGLRLFFDALAGASQNSASLGTAATRLDESDWFVQGALAGGLQYRLLRELSIGLRAKWLVSDDPLWDVREALRLSNAFPWALTGGVAWHF